MEEQWDSIETEGPKPHPSLWITLNGGPVDGRHVEVGAALPIHYVYPAPILPPALQPAHYEVALYEPTSTRDRHGYFIYEYRGVMTSAD
jgi:hypothetical protein